MKDQAVEEVRERRRRLIKDQYHGSIHAFVSEIVRWGTAHPDKVENLRQRRKQEAA